MLPCYLYEFFSFLFWEVKNFVSSVKYDTQESAREEQERRDEELARQLQEELQRAAREERIQQQLDTQAMRELLGSTSQSSNNLVVDAEELERERLREEQNRAYEETQKRDAEIERLRLEEEERKQKREEDRKKKASLLPAEPNPETEKNITQFAFKIPNNNERVTRYFRHGETLNTIFDFLDVNYQMDPEKFCIVVNYPVRKFTAQEHGMMTIAEVNLAEKQIAAFIQEVQL